MSWICLIRCCNDNLQQQPNHFPILSNKVILQPVLLNNGSQLLVTSSKLTLKLTPMRHTSEVTLHTAMNYLELLISSFIQSTYTEGNLEY